MNTVLGKGGAKRCYNLISFSPNYRVLWICLVHGPQVNRLTSGSRSRFFSTPFGTRYSKVFLLYIYRVWLFYDDMFYPLSTLEPLLKFFIMDFGTNFVSIFREISL